MGYQSDSILNILSELNKKYYLPAIQREFVWSPEQVEGLFDSIMSGYPIGTFLFWEVKGDQIGDFDFYNFIQNYADKSLNQSAKDIGSRDSITAILDGQQRLTSLYIGLMGSYAWKNHGNEKENKVRNLYLNLLYKRNEDDGDKDYNYEFKFLTPEEAKQKSEKQSEFWFKISGVLDQDFSPNDFEKDNDYYGLRPHEDKEDLRRITRLLEEVGRKIKDGQGINFYTEKNSGLDKVLEIFVRVNKGGVKLSYSDLLLSMATATWGQTGEGNARDEVSAFLKNLREDYLFDFDKDFIMKSWLYMPTKIKDVEGGKEKAHVSPVAFEIKNFKDAMEYIKQDWADIKSSINESLSFIRGLGYVQDFLPSAYVLLPVALHHKLHGDNAFKGENEARISKWISNAILKRVFGGKPDSILTLVRKVQYEEYNNGCNTFPLERIADELKSGSKSIYSDDGDIEDMLDSDYGERTRIILSQLFIAKHARGYNVNSLHQDHIYPQSWFKNEEAMRRYGFPENSISDLLKGKAYNKLVNLAFMAGNQNRDKSNKKPDEWFNAVNGQDIIKTVGFIPKKEVQMSIENHQKFWAARREIMHQELKEILLERPSEASNVDAA